MRPLHLLATVLVLLPLCLHAGLCGNQGPGRLATTPSLPGAAPYGMAVEAVYAQAPAAAATARADLRQAGGLSLETVGRWTFRYTLRRPGRVAVDETQVYRLSATSRGWIRGIGPAAVGSVVERGEALAAYSALGSGAERADREAAAVNPASVVQVRSPVSGLVLACNVSAGKIVERGTELYAIADLSRVFILANAFEDDARAFKPGARARVTQPVLGRTLSARVSSVLPQSNPALRTLALRLEAENPGFVLRPDMVVDIELPVELGPALTVPRDAVVDAGNERIVYVETSEGTLERRRVETGFRQGARVEVVSGLADGERVVTSRAAAAGEPSDRKTR